MAAMHLAVLDGDVCLALGLLAVCCCHIGVELLLQWGNGQSALLLPERAGMAAVQAVALQKQVARDMHAHTSDTSHHAAPAKVTQGREQAGMAGMQPSLLLSTKGLMSTLRADRTALHYRGLTFASSSSFRRR